MIARDLTLLERVQLRVSVENVSSLIDFTEADGTSTWTECAWDLRRQCPDGGLDELRRWAFLAESEDEFEDLNECVDQIWHTSDRAFSARRDVLLIDAMRDAQERGWKSPPEVAAMIDMAIAAERARINDEESKWQAEADADHAAWLSSGEPDWMEGRRARMTAVPIPLIPQGTPGPSGIPLLRGQAVVVDLGQPVVSGFLAGQQGRPAADAPTLPEGVRGHPLFDALNTAVGHIVGAAERSPVIFRAASVVDTLAVLCGVHAETVKAVVARVRALGASLPEGKLQTAIARFETAVQRELRAGAGWRTNSRGEPDPLDSDNVGVLLQQLEVETRFNVWSQRVELRWQRREWVPLTDAELNRLRSIASQAEHRFRPAKDWFRDMLADQARQTSYDPVIDWIDAAAWDNTPRLDTWLSRACGVPDDSYHRAVGRNIVGGIIRRARHPGAKHDEVAILIGPQGCGKSTLCRILALKDEWFTDSIAFDGSPQNVIPQLFGKLVIELSELDGMARREVQHIKRFLSAQSDYIALKYEALASERARRAIFIGTSNDDAPLADLTGNRRFLPIRVEQSIDTEWLRENVLQLIAEAAEQEAKGDKFGIPPDVWPVAAEHQESARSESAVETLLRSWFLNVPENVFITSADLVQGLTMAKQGTSAKMVAPIMKRLSFRSVQGRAPVVGKVRAWVRSNTDNLAECVQLAPVRISLGGPVEMKRRFVEPPPIPGQVPPPP